MDIKGGAFVFVEDTKKGKNGKFFEVYSKDNIPDSLKDQVVDISSLDSDENNLPPKKGNRPERIIRRHKKFYKNRGF